jgi:hypothetical protein
MKASEVITKARYTLSDLDKSRWSDDRLLSLLNDAILDVALTTRIYNSSSYIKLQKDVANYNVNDFAIKIERVEYLNKPLNKLSFNQMDSLYGNNWQIKRSDNLEAIVYDLKHSGEFILYPIPTLGANSITSNSDYGIITGLSYQDATLEIRDNFGGIAEPDYENYLKLYYVKAPTQLISLDNSLDNVVDRTMLSSLAHYVSGAALRDNMDTRNRQMGNEEIAQYHNKKMMQQDNKITGNVKKVRETNYNPLG